MPAYNTPGVYIREISTLPASVAPVATAIPAFIGYTEIAERNGESLENVPTRISSLIEYEKYFGGPQPEPDMNINVIWNAEGNIQGVALDTETSNFSEYVMYYQMQLYFANGGGPCYIVSVGDYSAAIAIGDATTGLLGGLEAVALEDEPTLIVFPDARELLEADFYSLYVQALDQCNTLQDRFTIIDLHSDGDTINAAAEAMRSGIASDYLNYGAAYYPDLRTSLPYAYDEAEVNVVEPFGEYLVEDRIIVRYNGPQSEAPLLTIETNASVPQDTPEFNYEAQNNRLTITISDLVAGTTVNDLLSAWTAHGEKDAFTISPGANPTILDPNSPLHIVTDQVFSHPDVDLSALASINTQIYNQVKAEVAKQGPILAPSAAMAGIYARTDRDRGVWEAPANTPVADIKGPSLKITDADQENLNVDPGSGKSINAIRTFSGKGTLVWGARTLAGNDNEWRYVSTRRLFIMVEESIQKATSWAVFQPNDARTWIKVKAQIENFLRGLWRDGALAGAKAEEAFFVNVGLGVTMEPQDILEGRMNIEIGMAAVRPAEFVILKFSHKLQKS